MPRSHKLYGYIVKTRRNELGLTQKQLAEQSLIGERTIQDIEGKKEKIYPHKYATRKQLATILNLAILEAFPPDIDDFRSLLEERFQFERESIIHFTKKLDKNLVHTLSGVYDMYKKAIEDDNLHMKGLADRSLHTIIIDAHPNLERKKAVLSNQFLYINFFEIWSSHFPIDVYFKNSRDNNIPIHQKLFSAALSGDTNQMNEAYDLHLEASLKDIEALINCIDRI
ncbi:multiprotein-bridging factor 1 family protein [uncultured Nostoc sp.]|uniref:helix-turn-helix domain-containing protein n=1 Tax=uncultured Nostoc sp. TaxID=340711 RepID=UPI0035CC01AB